MANVPPIYEGSNLPAPKDPVARFILGSCGIEGDVQVLKRGPTGMQIKCLFESSHTGASPAGSFYQWSGSKPRYKCSDPYCSGVTLHEFLDALDYNNCVGEDDQIAPPRFQVHSPRLATRIQATKFIGLIGATTTGKSFAGLDHAANIVQGLPTFGREFRQGKVLYICAEGPEDFDKRKKALAQHRCVNLNDILVVYAVPNLMLAADVDALIELGSEHCQIAMVYIDTLARCMEGGNENDGKDMGTVIANCGRLQAALNASVVLVHHVGKAESAGARGWSGLKAALDLEITITCAGNRRTATITKSKDSADGQVFPFRLAPVTLPDGATSCVIEYGAMPARPAVVARRESGGRAQLLVSRTFTALAHDGAVDEQQLIDQVVQSLPIRPGKRDQRRGSVMRVIDAQMAVGRFCRDGLLLRSAA